MFFGICTCKRTYHEETTTAIVPKVPFHSIPHCIPIGNIVGMQSYFFPIENLSYYKMLYKRGQSVLMSYGALQITYIHAQYTACLNFPSGFLTQSVCFEDTEVLY